MEIKVSSKGQITLPKSVRHALGIDTGAMLELEQGESGCVMLRKKPVPGFFSKFAGLKAKGAPFASGDEAREALRVAEPQAPYGGGRKHR